jgi:hypothetical protein
MRVVHLQSSRVCAWGGDVKHNLYNVIAAFLKFSWLFSVSSRMLARAFHVDAAILLSSEHHGMHTSTHKC